jgi:hypothetical protein
VLVEVVERAATVVIGYDRVTMTLQERTHGVDKAPIIVNEKDFSHGWGWRVQQGCPQACQSGRGSRPRTTPVSAGG